MSDEKIKVRLLGGDRTLEVTFPTDEQWQARQRTRKIITQDLGSGASMTDVMPSGEFDNRLLTELAGGENSFAPEDATLVLNNLSQATVEDVADQGSSFVVRLRTCFATQEIQIGKPTSKQFMEYRRGFARPIDLPHGKTEIRTNLRVASDLFDTLAPEHRAMSIVHKVPVIAAVIQEIDRMLDPATEVFRKGS